MKNAMPNAHANNGRTVAAYENYARRYAAERLAAPFGLRGFGIATLRGQCCLPAVAYWTSVPGPGWDADFLEATRRVGSTAPT